jgi:2-oxoglutarate dehydrogenase E1 component
MSALLKAFERSSYLYGTNAPYIEGLYQRFLDDPAQVSGQWRRFFQQVTVPGESPPPPPSEPAPAPLPAAPAPSGAEPPLAPLAAGKQAAVLRLINAYRVRGHQNADLDPLHLRERPPVADLMLAFHGLDDEDLDQEFDTGSLVAPDRMPLRDILRLVRDVYTGSIGSEYMHITRTQEKRWIQNRLEGSRAHLDVSTRRKHWLLQRLTAAEGLERYLHTRYVGQKRFSLEGAESLIPLLDELLHRAGTHGVKEAIIGMAHRGRLNVLVNILGKSPAELFQEFEGDYDPKHQQGAGDVKYHQGFSSDIRTPGGPLHLALAFNPSHLEIVSPVVEGSVRARQQRRHDRTGDQVLPVLIHGDAAFAGQGVVMETLQMSQARGFTTGGTVHVVVNNQIGFTTSDPIDARSTFYCTDVAKMVQAPIFHVNGDDPEAVLFITQLALDFRMEFHKDVVVDLVCYRRHGHNEADEPAATQPMMYRKIKARPTTREIYARHLEEEGVLLPDQAQDMVREYRDALDAGRTVVEGILDRPDNPYLADWRPYVGIHWEHPAHTAVSLETIRELAVPLTQPPQGFELHPRVARIIDDRRKMAAGALPIDWGFAETMAYATLLMDGFPIRLSGQDSGRGTFFHRHAVLHNQKDGSTHVPLQHLSEHQPNFTVIDSLLSEEAVLGFEYGYATTQPEALVIWEAQFGDFANVAQVVIDQFISSGEAKWRRLSGLTLFLPHGYEGQGAEHSSARLERYLQLCAEHNIQVCVPTTPAQMFHLLRRQMLRPYRHPLIVLTPKSLLRHKLSVSSLEDLTDRTYQTVMADPDRPDPDKVRRVVLCSGKVFFDLLERRRSAALEDIAILRIEQLYPFPGESYRRHLKRYRRATELVWCQEEPMNQGAWYPSQHHFRAGKPRGMHLSYAGRPAAAAPAVGRYALHVAQQTRLVNEALGIRPPSARSNP